jgi:flagellar biosynthesis chaperone FliJ
MSGAFLEHSHFEELCMRASLGQISSHEYQELSDHILVCAYCRDSYNDFMCLTHEQLPLAAAENASTSEPTGFFEKIASHAYKERFAARARERGIEILPVSPTGSGSWSLLPAFSYGLGFAIAIVILVTSVGVLSHRWKDAEGRNAAFSSQVSNLSQQIGALRQKLKELSRGKETVETDLAKTRNESATEAVQLRELQDLVDKDNLAIQDLQAQLNSSNTHATEADQNLRDSQQTLASLNQEVTKLRASHVEDIASLAAQAAQVADLFRQAKDSNEIIDKQTKLLAVNDDVRNLMSARNLHITDVFDIDGTGSRKRAFGRVFYTEGKSLVFYAFDLDQPKVTNARHSFQAWAQLSDASTSAVNLGLFYVDDAAQKRWMLTFDNPQVLDRISAVFVTAEPRGGTARPTGQKLMFAYLGHEPNHP